MPKQESFQEHASKIELAQQRKEDMDEDERKQKILKRDKRALFLIKRNIFIKKYTLWRRKIKSLSKLLMQAKLYHLLN
jgi:hypothetical protein